MRSGLLRGWVRDEFGASPFIHDVVVNTRFIISVRFNSHGFGRHFIAIFCSEFMYRASTRGLFSTLPKGTLESWSSVVFLGILSCQSLLI